MPQEWGMVFTGCWEIFGCFFVTSLYFLSLESALGYNGMLFSLLNHVPECK